MPRNWIICFFIFPILAGYRHMLSGRTYGFYLQPMTGYTIGSTAIIRKNAGGQPATNANGDTRRGSRYGDPLDPLGIYDVFPKKKGRLIAKDIYTGKIK